MEKKHSKSTKRFGTRYGRSPRDRVAKVEVEYHKNNKCPYCGKVKVKRLAIGIWFCRACKAKFAGKAYSITKKIVTKEKEAPEEEIEVKEEVSETEEEA